MEIAHQKLETKDLRRWVLGTTRVLGNNKKILDGFNSFPVANFNTGTNLWATWFGLSTVVPNLAKTLKEGPFMACLANSAAKYPHGSAGMFLASFLSAIAKSWLELPLVRPVDLLTVAENVYQNFQTLTGDVILDFGLTGLARKISDELSTLEVFTFSQILDTALVCAQQQLVDSADTHNGVGDAGLAGACIILASLSDVVAEKDGETASNLDVVQTMLSEWTLRSGQTGKTFIPKEGGNDLEVTFQQEGFAPDLEKRRQELAVSCSEMLLSGTTDELGFGFFTTHAHTTTPLSVLSHPYQGVLVEQLVPPEKDEAHLFLMEDPLPEVENVVLFSRKKESHAPWNKLHLVVLSQSPALAEMYARGGATVMLNPRDEADVYWALLGGQERLTIIVPSSSSTAGLAEDATRHETVSPVIKAPTVDELSALWLCAAITPWYPTGTVEEAKSRLEVEMQQVLSTMRVEKMSENLESQLDDLSAFSAAETTEVFALIGASQPTLDRAKLQTLAAGNPRVELTVFYGGQNGATLLGVRSDKD